MKRIPKLPRSLLLFTIWLLIGAGTVMSAGCKPDEKFSPMLFGVYADYPSYLYIRNHSIKEIRGEIKLYQQLGVDIIRIDVRYDHWLKNDAESIGKLEAAIEEVRKGKQKLWLSAYGVEEWNGKRLEDYGSASWEDWKKMYRQQVSMMATHYKPDYLMILPEAPSLMQNQISEEIETNSWVSFAEEIASSVRKLLPDSKIVAVTALQIEDPRISNREYFRQLMQNDNDIDIVGVNPYSTYELKTYTNKYALPYLNPAKELWITEFWDNWKIEYRDGDSATAIKEAIYYAQDKGIVGFIPFPGGWGFHDDNLDTTDAFDAYKDMIERVNR